MTKAPGMVSIHAHTTWLATPHRTADRRGLEPTPTMAPGVGGVADKGMPAAEAKNKVLAAADSAANPPTGCNRVIFDPMVFTMRHPPESVPRPIAVSAASTTQSGTSAPAGRCLVAISTARMTPIVFCASLAP